MWTSTIRNEIKTDGRCNEKLTSTLWYDGDPSVWLMFNTPEGLLLYEVPKLYGTGMNMYFTKGNIPGRDIWVYVRFETGSEAETFAQEHGFSWDDWVGIKAQYNTSFAPSTVSIGQWSTNDASDFKVFKIGKGTYNSGKNAFDVDFDGNANVDGNLVVGSLDCYQGHITITEGDIKAINGNVSCDQVNADAVFTRNPDGKLVSLLDLIYPVGAIYMSVYGTDPGTLIGGTWERIKDKFLLSAGDTYGGGATGGSAEATLPAHTHTVGSDDYQLWGAKKGAGSTEPGNQISGDAKYYAAVKGNSTANYKWLASVDSTGVRDVSQANMPPYLAVYVWKRIS